MVDVLDYSHSKCTFCNTNYIFIFFFRWIMSARTSRDELPTRNTTIIQTFLETCALDADHKALEEHLVSNQVQQNDLDRCLLRGLRLVKWNEKELSHVAPALTLLLQSGAKWNSDILLAAQTTPYHIICESPGDHHELLDLMIKLSQQAIINTRDINGCTALSCAIEKANIDCMKCLIANESDVTTKDDMVHAINKGNLEAVRYLLEIGVNISSYTPEIGETQCEHCKEKRLVVDVNRNREYQEPCIRAIRDNKLEIVKLLDEFGSQICKSFTALRHAVRWGNVEVVSYLLKKYTYPLNIEYTITSDQSEPIYTLLKESISFLRRNRTAKITKILLDHGADPDKRMCATTSVNAIMTAICYGNLDVIAQYIRNGVDINFKSYFGSYENVLPFEASVLCRFHIVAEMLLISGCSSGVFNLEGNHEFNNYLTPEMKNLMQEWKLQENNATPLQQRCRSVILNHLSPRADIKIENLPLPKCLIQFLNIPELDDILDANKKAFRY